MNGMGGIDMHSFVKAAPWVLLALSPMAACGGVQTVGAHDAGADASVDAPPADDGAPDVTPDMTVASDSPDDASDADAGAGDASDGGARDGDADATPVEAGDGAAACVPRPSGVVSWWRADGDFKDAVGTNGGASAGAGAVTFVPGEVETAFSLDGAVDAYVLVPDSTSLELTAAITIDAWIDASVLGGRIVDKITAGGTDGYMLDTLAGNLRFIIGGNVLSSTTPLPTSAFTHVAAVYDGLHMTVFINGAPAGTLTTAGGAIPTSTLPLRIGADSTGNTRFTGIIDEVRVFDRALAVADVQAIYQQGSAARCP